MLAVRMESLMGSELAEMLGSRLVVRWGPLMVDQLVYQLGKRLVVPLVRWEN